MVIPQLVNHARLVVGQPGQLQRVAEPAALAQSEFFFQEEVDEVEVAHLGGLGPFDQLGDDIGDVAQAESGGMVTDPVGGQSAHRVSPSTGFVLAAAA